jgi:hypothetical protein
MEDNARMRESEIGWVSELQGVAAVLLEHLIACGRQRGRLTMADRSCSGAPRKVWCSGEEMAVEMQMRESKRECVGCSRTCSGSRRRRGHAGAGSGKPAGVVAARAAA